MREFVFVPEGQEKCSVKAWIHSEDEQAKYPAVLICPGGGYEHVSPRESEPVARVFFDAGYNTFILTYSILAEAAQFRPLCQLASAIADIRKNSIPWNTIPDKIAVCGFSAGGHLAASLGVLYHEPEFLKAFSREENIRPDAMILCYPVILADEFAHVGSISRVSGCEEGTPGYQWFGLAQHVDAATPPTFLWHTAEDGCVPVENSLKMAGALSAAKVPFELHVFPKGGHGMSVCTEEVGTPSDYNARWTGWCVRWLKELWQHSSGQNVG